MIDELTSKTFQDKPRLSQPDVFPGRAGGIGHTLLPPVQKEEFSEPRQMDEKRIIFWSKSLKQLEGIKEGSAIRTKALAFLRKKLVQYDPEFQCWFINPIKGYNKTRYKVSSRDDNHFECECQFYNKVSKNWEHPVCSHIESVKLWLEIKNWNNTIKITGGEKNGQS